MERFHDDVDMGFERGEWMPCGHPDRGLERREGKTVRLSVAGCKRGFARTPREKTSRVLLCFENPDWISRAVAFSLTRREV